MTSTTGCFGLPTVVSLPTLPTLPTLPPIHVEFFWIFQVLDNLETRISIMLFFFAILQRIDLLFSVDPEIINPPTSTDPPRT